MNKFDITKACPQIYIYIGTVITSALLASRYSKKEVIPIIITGVIVSLLLLNFNYCSDKIQWLTWMIAGMCILSATGNLILFFSDDKEIQKQLSEK